ncbi:MAG: aldo/keto reductase, partial [Anaerolineales bacterium]|nr:aldo/keto reductase [Anaerolineales bacterium]
MSAFFFYEPAPSQLYTLTLHDALQIQRGGCTGLSVSRLGVGMSEIGYYLSRDETARAAAVLNLALDNGMNFLDTAACYDLAEEFIGRTVSHRRAEFV